MSAGTWLVIAIVGFVLAAVGLVASVVLFFRLNILSVIGDLSGRTVAREIKAIREANAASGNKIHRSSRVNLDRGPLTDVVNKNAGGKAALGHLSKRLDQTTGEMETDANHGKPEKRASLRSNKEKSAHAYNSGSEATDVLKTDATDVLRQDATDVLRQEGGTDVLHEETEVLSSTETETLRTETEVLRRDDTSDATTTLSDLPSTDKTDLLQESGNTNGATDVLDVDNTQWTSGAETELLSNDATDLLTADEAGTALLDGDGAGTTILRGRTEELSAPHQAKIRLTITRSIKGIHTDETI